MREILFRGKRVDNGEWVEGYLILKGNQTFISSFPYFVGKVHETSWLEFCFGGFIEVIPETVGQYIGLPDKNGKKIFEGNIVKYKEYILQVEYAEEYASYFFHNSGSVIGECIAKYVRKYAEIIGNIHDNPELLEVGE